MKNRDRRYPTFANINLLGKCNMNCYFCLGKDLENYNLSMIKETHFSAWPEFDNFLEICTNANIKKLYITGQNMDSLQYNYLGELIEHLKTKNFFVGLRTNGLLATQKYPFLTQCNDEIGFTFISNNEKVVKSITGVEIIPDWKEIFSHCQMNNLRYRVSYVITKYNIHEFFENMLFLSKYNPLYIQIRKISTDYRQSIVKDDREIYEKLKALCIQKYAKIGEYYTATILNIFGSSVIFWATTETSINSYNYFIDGTISKEYFVVEGYEKSNELQFKI